MDAPPVDARIGTTLQGRYRILEALAQGGMGIVYRAERVGIERAVAIKFLHASIGEHKEYVQRFEREARAMSKLSHPHCVPVIDFGVHGDAPYIVMEFVSGRTLLDLIQLGPVPAPRAIHIVQQVLSGLAHAHGQGIVHRDVKPANIVLVEVTGTGDHARILDFGLAKLLDAPGVSWSTAQTAVGTPSYMSPEQARGEEADARADQYAVGVMLYELLTGKKPFYGKDPFDLLKKHIHQLPPPLSQAGGPTYSTQLEAVVRRTLAKQPGDRFASALELRAALAATPEAADLPRPFTSSTALPAHPPLSVEARAVVPPDSAVIEVAPKRRRGFGLFVLLLLVAGGAFGWRWAREHGLLERFPMLGGGRDGASGAGGDAGTVEEGTGLAALVPDAAAVAAVPDAAGVPAVAAVADAGVADAAAVAPADASVDATVVVVDAGPDAASVDARRPDPL